MAGEITLDPSLGAEVCPHTGLPAQDTATAMQAATAILKNPPSILTEPHVYHVCVAPFPRVAPLVRTLDDGPMSRRASVRLSRCSGAMAIPRPTRKPPEKSVILLGPRTVAN